MDYIYKYIIRPTPSFENELEFIYNYVAFKLKELKTAENLYIKVMKEIYNLQYFPERFIKIKFKDKTYRKLPINKYIVIYEVDNNTRPSLYLTYFSW